MSVVEVLDDGEPAARARDPDEVRIKCAWLKQKKVDDETKLPLLDFDEQTQHTFNRRKTTFRMVKHSCSYPAPPHKVRMWCSSLGAAPDLPPSMDLNMFINTFELITEEKHTLEMAHLTGGETIAFEMVQGEQLSELSTFLLGSKAGGAQIKPKIVTVDKRTIKQSLTQSVQKLAEELEAERAHARGEPPHAPLSKEEKSRLALVLKEQAAAAELERKKMADELIAEEEEEARRREKKKAKKKGKKEKQVGGLAAPRLLPRPRPRPPSPPLPAARPRLRPPPPIPRSARRRRLARRMAPPTTMTRRRRRKRSPPPPRATTPPPPRRRPAARAPRAAPLQSRATGKRAAAAPPRRPSAAPTAAARRIWPPSSSWAWRRGSGSRAAAPPRCRPASTRCRTTRGGRTTSCLA